MEDSKERRCSSITSPSPSEVENHRASEAIVREWILRFATNCGQALNEAQLLLWIEQLAPTPADILVEAFPALLRSRVYSNMPTIGEIFQTIGQVEARRALEKEIAARLEWESKKPPQPPWEELHRRGLVYTREIFEAYEKLEKLRKKHKLKIASDPIIVTAERLAALEEEKKILKKKGFLK